MPLSHSLIVALLHSTSDTWNPERFILDATFYQFILESFYLGITLAESQILTSVFCGGGNVDCMTFRLA